MENKRREASSAGSDRPSDLSGILKPLPEQEKELWEPEDSFTSEEEYKRIGKEKEESLKMPEYIRHADIPYRPVLSALLKTIPEHDKRKVLLDQYYRYFWNVASK